MKLLNSSFVVFIKRIFFAFFLLLGMSACDRTSSPEGRMSIKLEDLQKEMRDSLKKQNEAILDSLGKIREDLRKIEMKK